MTGRVISQSDTTITVRRRGTNYPIQRARVKHRAPAEVPALDVYTGDEFYNEKLTELAPGEDADKHILLADVLMRVRDYDRAEQHLQKAAELGDSRQSNLLEGKIDKLRRYKGARAEREHLDLIRVTLARRDFKKGVTLIDEFEQKYPNTKLQSEFLRTQKLFEASRERFLLYRVSELWYGSIAVLADEKARAIGVSYDAAKEYAEEGMGKDIRARVQSKLGIEIEEIEDLWARRLDKQSRTPRPQRFSFGVGSWTLGASAVTKDTVAADQEVGTGSEGNKDMERMVERIRKAQERARRALSRQRETGEAGGHARGLVGGRQSGREEGMVARLLRRVRWRPGRRQCAHQPVRDLYRRWPIDHLRPVRQGAEGPMPHMPRNEVPPLDSSPLMPPRGGALALRATAVCSLLWPLMGCAGTDTAAGPGSSTGGPLPSEGPTVKGTVEASAARASDVDPSVLLPSADTTDDVVARVGGLAIYKRHIYEHLGETEPAAQRAQVEAIVLDALVAQAAQAWDIRLDVATVDKWTSQQQEQLREVVDRQLGGRSSFERYVRSQFGMTLEEHARWLRTKNIRALYQQHVVRFAAMREDRVEVRYVVNSDRAVLDDIATKTRQGASFATLALRHTEDSNKLDRGRLPPFGRSFDHPATEVAFDLEVGQLSDVFMREAQGSKRYYLVYCLRKIPAREASYAEVKDELERLIEAHPLSGTEFRAAVMCLKAQMETLNSGGEKR